MGTLLRAVAYAAVFIGFVLVFLPAQVLREAGVTVPESFGVAQATGVAMTVIGAALALWCVVTFAFVGKGTPAPFDPPRRLVVRGPYRVVRNPMYIGAALALGGAALYFESTALAAFVGLYLVVTHAFVRFYEEPTLRRTFGEDYAAYCRRVRRWLPTW